MVEVSLGQDLVDAYRRYVVMAEECGVKTKPKLHMMMHLTHRPTKSQGGIIQLQK